MIRRFLTLVCLLLIAGSVMAEGGRPKTSGWTPSSGPGFGSNFFSSDSACASFAYTPSLSAGNCSVSQCACGRYSNGNFDPVSGSAKKTLSCPASYPIVGGDGLCYVESPKRCPDGTWNTDLAQCAPAPPCAPGYIDQGLDGQGSRICVAKVCPSPSVLHPDGTCGAAPRPPEGEPCTDCGPVGPTGAQGPKGDTGLAGEKGATGSEGIAGSVGAKGDKGDKGDFGATGFTGAQGVAGVAGASGATGAQGLKGDAGSTGAAGAAGAAGAQGAKGDLGAQGIQGVQGVIGATGLQGIQGLDGLAGAAGVNGADGAQGETGETGLSFCQENPGLAVCRDSSVGGSCGEITCNGDAIQCQTLRAAAAMQCAQKKSDDDLNASPLKAIGENAVSGIVDPSLPTPANGQVVQAPDFLDTTGFLGGRSCFVDKTITIQGHAITIPLSKSCDILLVLRYALMVVAGLVSFRLLSGAILT